MNKAIWGVLGVLVIIVLGAFFFSRNNKVSVPTTPTTTESMMVTYSDSGFSPASITVKVGDTVTFKNQSGKSMWVASAPHPTHTAYPEFDAKKGVAMGESYMFTFTKAGTWEYHNHLNPTSFGTIVVE
jgi:plastocyanin